MKISTLIGTAALLLLFGIAAPAYAQDHPDQQDSAKPPDTKPSTHDEKQAEPPKSPNDQPRPAEKDARPAKEEKPAEAPPNDKPAKAPQQDAAHRDNAAAQHGGATRRR